MPESHASTDIFRLIVNVQADLVKRRERGESILLESYLAKYAELNSDDGILLDLILFELHVRRRLGDEPTLEEYQQRFPRFAVVIVGLFTMSGSKLAAAETSTPGQSGLTPAAETATLPSPPPAQDIVQRAKASASDWEAHRAVSPPGYEIVSVLGRGGMGVVYKARQVKLNRTVALKMILAGGHAGPEELQRFRTEAEAVARLQHPGIVHIYDVGEHQGVPYFSLEFVGGGSLDRKLQGVPLPPRAAARLTAMLAVAIQAAHEKGILHRDLKPANIFLQPVKEGGVTIEDHAGATGRFVPKIGDFGLAKRIDAEPEVRASPGLTATGAIMGTPSYMAPEQASGKTKELTEATDVYALGAILYELLTGRPPFRAATAMETVLQVVRDDPAPPNRLNAKIPRDLETICLKCLRKEPGKRYASARELAADLKRFLNGEAIHARAVGRLERTIKWARRRPAVAALVCVSVFALIAMIAGAAYFTAQLQRKNKDLGDAIVTADNETKSKTKALEDVEKEKDKVTQEQSKTKDALKEVEKERDRAKTELHRFQLMDYHSQIAAADRAIQENDFVTARLKLDACRWDFRNVEYHYLCHELKKEEPRTLQGHTREVHNLAMSADGKRLCSGGMDNAIKVWDLIAGRETHSLPVPESGIAGLALSADGKRLAWSTWLPEPVIKVWDLDKGKEYLTLSAQPLGATQLALSADGKRLCGCSIHNTIKVWDLVSGKELVTLTHGGGLALPVNSVVLSPDGKRLFSGGTDNTIRLWDLDSGKETFTLRGHANGIYSLALSADGKRLFSGSDDIKVWDLDAGKEIITLHGHSNLITSLALSTDGKRLFSGSDDKTIKVWDVEVGNESLTLRGHSGTVFSLALSADGKRLWSGSRDATIKVWNLEAVNEARTLHGHSMSVNCLASPANGKRLYSCSADTTIKVWDLESGKETLTLVGHEHFVNSLALSASGKWLISGGTYSPIKVWDLESGTSNRTLRGPERGISRLKLSADDKRLFSGSQDGTIRVWDIERGEEILTLPAHTSEVSDLAVSADGKWLCSVGRFDTTNQVAVGDWDTIKVWDLEARKVKFRLRGHHEMVSSLALSPDGKQLFSASFDRTIKIWDLEKGTEIRTLRGHQHWVASLLLSADGKRLFSGSFDNTIRIWEAETGNEVLTLGNPCAVGSLALSADGKRLFAVGGRDIYVWDLDAELAAARAADGLVLCDLIWSIASRICSGWQ